LLGVKSGNGKSQVLDVMRGLLPASAVCSIPPGDFQDEKKLIPLVGKLLNATDEISSSDAITSTLFKKIVTCNPTSARDLYKPVVTFKPMAQHVMNANGLPPLKGGMGPADIRRLIVIPFNRRIPKEERIPGLGERIAREETDLVLAWAVEGLLRVARNGWLFTELAASVELIEDWLDSICPVTRFLNSDWASVVPPTGDGQEQPPVSTRAAYKWFQEYERAEGLRGDQTISFNTFTNRVKASGLGVEYKRKKNERLFLNLRLEQSGRAYAQGKVSGEAEGVTHR
jgi:phage/plasmid-associated DNA primase